MERPHMRRKLNVKLFLYLVGGTALLAGALFVVHRLQAGQIASGLLWQADRAEKEGRPDQAARYLRRDLEFERKDMAPGARRGGTLASPQLAVTPRAREQARFVLEQVLARDPDRHDLRRLLVRVALDLGRVEQAGEHLDRLQKIRPADDEEPALFAQWYQAQGQDTDAAHWLRKAIKQAPKAVDSYVRLAYLLRRLDRARQGAEARDADKVMNDLVAANAGNFEAYLARWRYYRAFNTLKADALDRAG